MPQAKGTYLHTISLNMHGRLIQSNKGHRIRYNCTSYPMSYFSYAMHTLKRRSSHSYPQQLIQSALGIGSLI